MNAAEMRGIERLVIDGGAILFGFLGYRLFVLGHTQGAIKGEASSKFGKLVFSGTGPGLGMMFFAAVVLVVSLLRGGATSETVGPVSASQRDAADEPMARASRRLDYAPTDRASSPAIPPSPLMKYCAAGTTLCTTE